MTLLQRDEKAIFNAARQIDAPAARRSYLEQACGEDHNLRARVEALLRIHEEEKSFLQSPAEGIQPTPEAPISEGPGTVIGPYRLLESLGVGGFGVVFLAEQHQPVRRQVALKVLKPGMDTRQVLARFEAERQALALMDHPNIAHLLDGGETASGRPYFVMELVRGVPVTEFCDQNHFTVGQRLELFVSICQAVQHAHQKGIIHRDLKPSNVLVTQHDGSPVVKVIDFGIARALDQKLTDRTLLTNCAQLVGTPLYMSPEQAEMSGLDIDTRADIYALGVLLYELLTGTTPFDRERLRAVAFDELRRIIREEEPARPSARISTIGEGAATVSVNRNSDPKRLRRLFRGELDWIVMKALEKDRNRRYESASAFGQDVQRYLHDEPVQACPPSAWYRFGKFARRHKGRLAVATGLFLAVTVMAASIGWAVRDRAARQAEAEQAAIVRRAIVASQVRDSLNTARALIADNKLASAHQKLAQARGQLGNDWSALGSLAAEVEAGEAELERFQQFLDLIDQAHQAETAPPLKALLAEGSGGGAETLTPPGTGARRPDAAVPFLLEALQRYGVLEGDPWNSTLGGGLLGRLQVEQVRRLAYEELLWLAHDIARRKQEHRTGRKLSPAAAARQALVYLGKAESAHRPTSALYEVRAGCRKILGEAAAAQADTQRAVQTPPTLALDHALRGQAAYDAKQLTEGVQAFEAALPLEPTHYWSLMRLGYCLCDLGRGPEDFAGAARVFTGCILKRPDHAHAYYCRANAYVRLRRYEDSIADSSRAIELDPKYAIAWNNRGLAYAELGQPDKALPNFSRAVELDPKFAIAWNNRAWAHEQLGQPGKAVDAYSQAIDLGLKHPAVWNNRGVTYTKVGLLDKAVADFSSAIEMDSKLAIAWKNRGVAYFQLGQLNDAVTDFTRAIDLDPRDAAAWYARAGVYSKRGQLEKAADDFSRAIALNPKVALAWYNRGMIYNEQGQPGRAIADFSQAITLDPKYAPAWKNRGVAHFRLRQFDNAVADFSRAIDLDPKDALAWQSRGAAYNEQGHPGKAADDFSEAIKLNAKDAEAWKNRGVARCQLGELEKAVADLTTAIELAPSHPQILQAYMVRAYAHTRLERFAQARTDYQAALKRAPADAWVHDALAWLLATCPDVKLRDPGQAVGLARRAVRLASKEGDYWKTLGVAHYRAGDWTAAVAALEKALELRQRGDAVERLFLAMARQKLGKRDEARKAYEQAVQWLEKNQKALEKDEWRAEELRRFRAEAEEVLELKKN